MTTESLTLDPSVVTTLSGVSATTFTTVLHGAMREQGEPLPGLYPPNEDNSARYAASRRSQGRT